MYKHMVLYIEACHSGSMFEGILANNTGVYAVAAAHPSESSYGTYCYPNDAVHDNHFMTCLGDLFSVTWMEDAESADPTQNTLELQF